MVNLQMFRFSKTSRSHLRAVRVYLVGLLLLTFILLSTNLVSLVLQHRQVTELSADNLRANTGRLALDLENQAGQLATSCLKDERLAGLLADPAVGSTPEDTRKLRQDLAVVGKQFLLAQSFFVLRGKEVVFPRLASWPSARQEGSFRSQGETAPSGDYWSMLRRGDTEDARGRHDQALDWLRRAEALPVARKWKALTLAKIGRVCLESNRLADAEKAYRELFAGFGDEYGETGIPYTLDLVQLPKQLAERIYPDIQKKMQSVFNDLVSGRWELSGEQLDFYLEELEGWMSREARGRPETDFLDHFRLAKALKSDIDSRKAPFSEEIFARTIGRETGAYYTYWRTTLDRAGASVIFGLSVDLKYLSSLAASRLQLAGGQYAPVEIVALPAAGPDDATGVAASERSGVFIPFDRELAGLAVKIPTATIRAGEAAVYREMLFLGMSLAMFLSVMGLGVYLLVRVTRDLQFVELRTDFVNSVSHEFKTPLSLIRLYSETLADGDEEFSAEERRNYVRIIARESQRLGQLIDNVLGHAGIERGRKAEESRPGNLGMQVLQTVRDYSRYLSEHGFTIETRIEPSLPLVRFDRSGISQVVLNLLDNARKYSGHSKMIRVRMWSRDGEVVLEVEDNGLGIPAEEQSKIFEPFYQISDGRKKSGSGLGLYLVRHVMDGLGGRIEVQSQSGRGSKFTLYFPACEAASRHPDKAETGEALDARSQS